MKYHCRICKTPVTMYAAVRDMLCLRCSRGEYNGIPAINVKDTAGFFANLWLIRRVRYELFTSPVTKAMDATTAQMRTTLTAAMGMAEYRPLVTRAKTAYEYYRGMWEQTGDLRYLRLMTVHVTLEESSTETGAGTG